MTIREAFDLISPAGARLASLVTPSLGGAHPADGTAPRDADPDINSTPRVPPIHSPLQWADLGCGSGIFTEALVQLLPQGSIVYGVDTKPTVKPSASIKVVKADFIRDPLPGDLDGILMGNALHYVRDKPALLTRLRNYTRPDSPLIIIEYDTDIPVPTWVPYPCSSATLTRLLTDNGYAKIHRLGTRASVYGRANMYAVMAVPA